MTTQLEIRIGCGLEEINDPTWLWSVDIAYVTKGAVRLDDMEKLTLEQYLGLLRTIERVR